MGGHGKEIPERQIKLGALGFPAHGYRGAGSKPGCVDKSEEPEGAWSQEGGKRRYRVGRRGRRLKWPEDRGRSEQRGVGRREGGEQEAWGSVWGARRRQGSHTARSSPSSTQDVPGLREGEGSGASWGLGALKLRGSRREGAARSEGADSAPPRRKP